MTKQHISILITNMSSFEFRLKKIDETRNDLLDEIKNNDLMREKYEKTYKYLDYIEHLLFSVSTVTGCASILLNTIEVLISKTLIDSCISHGEFVSVNNILREYNEMKENQVSEK